MRLCRHYREKRLGGPILLVTAQAFGDKKKMGHQAGITLRSHVCGNIDEPTQHGENRDAKRKCLHHLSSSSMKGEK